MSYLIVIIFLALTFKLLIFMFREDCYKNKSVDEFHSNAFRIPFYTYDSGTMKDLTSALSPKITCSSAKVRVKMLRYADRLMVAM